MTLLSVVGASAASSGTVEPPEPVVLTYLDSETSGGITYLSAVTNGGLTHLNGATA